MPHLPNDELWWRDLSEGALCAGLSNRPLRIILTPMSPLAYRIPGARVDGWSNALVITVTKPLTVADGGIEFSLPTMHLGDHGRVCDLHYAAHFRGGVDSAPRFPELC